MGPALGLRRLPPVTYAEPSESESEAERERPRKYWELLRQLGFSDDKILRVRKSIGGAGMRSDPGLWDVSRGDCSGYERKARGVVMGLYADALRSVAEAVCGPEASEASLEVFKKRLKLDKDNADVCKQVVADARKKLLVPWARLLAASKKGTVERRVVRAVLCQTISATELAMLEDAVPGFSISRSIFTKSRQDFDLLCEDGVLNEDRTSRTRFDPTAVDSAIDALLEHQNVTYVAFGEKRFKVDGAVVSVPSIYRKRPVQDIYDDYKAVVGDNVVSRTTFYRLSRLITHGGMTSRKSATDALTGALLDDSVARLVRIVSDHLPAESELLAEKLWIVKDWLRHSFCNQGNASSAGCPRHDALFRLSSAPLRDAELRAVTCSPCLKMYTLQAHILQRLSEKQAGPLAISVADDCFRKMDMFMGYQLRVLNQQTAVNELFEQMRLRCEMARAGSDALVVIDLKRKIAPMCYGDKPVEPGNASGMSWNSAVVRFWAMEASEDGKPVEMNVYFDHITEQIHDKAAVVALIEAIIVSVKRDLPHMTSIAVQCDNASYLQSSLLAMVLPVLGAANGLQVSRLIYTESSNGKSLLDAHFARAMKKAKSWVQLGNDCTNPQHLVKALAADHGLPNSVTQLVEVDFHSAEEVVRQAAPIETALLKVVGVVNDVVYDYPLAGSSHGPTAFSTSPSYTLRAFSYPGIGGGIEVEIHPEGRRCVAKNAAGGMAEAVAYSKLEDEEGIDDDGLAGSLDEETVDEGELDADDEGEAGHEIVLPSTILGHVTGVKIVTIAQVRLRERRWKATASTTFLPITRSVSQPRAEDNKDIVAYTKRSLRERLLSGRLNAFFSTTLPAQMVRLCDGLTPQVGALKPLVHAGSARRSAHTNLYGAKYLTAFTADIGEILTSGQVTRWGKQAPARVLEELQYKYPNRYDLPGEHDIRAEMGRRYNPVVRVPPPKKQRQQLTTAPTQPVASNNEERTGIKRRSKLAVEYSVFLEALVAGMPSIKPLEALEAFRDKFPNASDTPDDKVKAKVSNLKTKALRRR